jgi:superkiller protein 3
MSDARAIYQEGFALFAKQDLDGAIAKYREAVEADPGFTLAWSALAMAHSRKGEIDEAIAAGQKAVELEPEEALGYTNLSIFYQQKGLIAEAEDAKARAMQLAMKAQGES